MGKTKSSSIKDTIILALKNSADPLTLEHLLRLVRVNQPKVAFSTIYRIMKRLKEDRLVLRVDWRERGSHYEWAERLHHHHITCMVCSQSHDVDDSVVSFNLERVTAITGYTFRNHYLELEGICAECRKRSRI